MTKQSHESSSTEGFPVAFEKVGDEILVLDHGNQEIYRLADGEASSGSAPSQGNGFFGIWNASTLTRRGVLTGAGAAGLFLSVSALPQPAQASSPLSQFVPLAERELSESPTTLSETPIRFAVIA